MSEPEQTRGAKATPLRLHIGGEEVLEGWKILNIQPGPGIDFVGDCTDLSQFADNSVSEAYASHVYEHLGYQVQFRKALAEVHRVLRPAGLLRVGVPDLDVLCRLFLQPKIPFAERYALMRIIYGGQIDEFDYHKVGLNFELLASCLTEVGFRNIRRVPRFGLFNDQTETQFCGTPISLNVMAIK